MINVRKNLKVGKDFLLSFIASMFTMSIVQILIFPLLSRIYSANQYGLILTLYGVSNTIIGTFGGSLNNTRLIVDGNYSSKAESGDFMPLLFLSTSIGIAVIYAYDRAFTNVSGFNVFLLIVYVVFGIVGAYGCSTYRLRINYTKNLIYSILIGLGQAVGLLLILFVFPQLWVLPFALGQIMGCLYLFIDSDIFRETFRISTLIIFTSKKYLILIITTLSANVLAYLDRLFLLPILGGTAVSSYTTAAFFGKTLGMISTPIAGVLLTYYAQKEFKMTKSKFWKINAIVITGGFVFFMASFFLAEPVTRFMYPDLTENALPYIRIANLAAIISIIANMTDPAILVGAKTYWQIIIQIVYCCVYLCLGIVLVSYFGLLGFSFATLSASIVRLAMLYIVGNISIRDSKYRNSKA